MEKFSIECLACKREVGEATRAEATAQAVTHLQEHHRAVGFPDPALSLIRLHPFYSLEVISRTDIELPPPDVAADSANNPPEGGAPDAPGGGEQPGPPANQS